MALKVREVLTMGVLLMHSLATSVDYLCVMQGLLDESSTELDKAMAQYYAVIGVLALCHTTLAGYTKFPEGFTFGVATAAHQIEGAWNMIADGSNGDVACDSYNRYKEDVEELSYLGVDFYRFSLSWARILPTGRSDYVNPDGIRYYNDLLDALAEQNIEPLVTLFHWDLPQTLQDLGGWSNPKMIEYFRDYSDVCFREFGAKIKSWITFNEPYEICEDAYGDEKKAPAIDSHGVGNYLCSDTLLKAHAESFHLYNETYRPKQNGRIMISINSIWYEPSDPDNAEQIALAEVANQFKFGWFAHPIFTTEGGYPAVMVENVKHQSEIEGLSKPRLEQFDEYWTQRIKGTSDFLGINHYTTHLVTGPGVDPLAKSPSWLKDIGAVVPTGFANLLRWCKSSYNDPPIYITENGFSDRGTLDDYGRINERFGFYYVDITRPDRPRIAKLSAQYYRQLTATRELPQDERFIEPSVRITLTTHECLLTPIFFHNRQENTEGGDGGFPNTTQKRIVEAAECEVLINKNDDRY
ncbi:Glucosidase [Operophtera brumata]|uniref:beta-glucosidase n=1 Tax=Operophtera brumata TaxID=104452 RepID=A0A0L7L473_OPEBR|nr:Glucosidase [Operophtera brumata]